MLDELYLEWAMDYCNNYFPNGKYPAGFKLAVKQLSEIDPLQFNISSQKLHDMSITYKDTDENGIPSHILKWLEPYRRLKTI